MSEESGLRERKKRETRRRISNVATLLFAARGFDAVTVAEVARAANVSKMTVFNYFPRKEDLFLDRIEDTLREVREVLAERPPGTSAARALRGHCHHLLDSGHPTSGVVPDAAPFFRLVADSSALRMRLLEQVREMEEVFAEVLTAERGDPMRARITAALLATTYDTVFRTAMRAALDGHPVDQVRHHQATVIDAAFDLVEHGLDTP